MDVRPMTAFPIGSPAHSFGSAASFRMLVVIVFPLLLLLLLLLMSLVSCAGGAGAGYVEWIEDGVRIRTYRSAVPPETDPYRLETDRVFGTDQGPDTYLLTQPWFVGEGADGTVYILDARAHIIHLFASDGGHLGTCGGPGQGPGEFSRGGLQAVLHEGDILAWDQSLHRLTVFSAAGEYRSSELLADLSSSTRPVPYGGTGNRRLLIIRQQTAIRPDSYTSYLKIFTLTSELEPNPALLDTVLSYPTQQVGSRTVMAPFTRQGPTVATAPDQPVAIWWPGEYRIGFLDPWSGETWATLLPIKSRPVTRELREWRVHFFVDAGLEAEARRGLSFPARLPFIGAMEWGSDGRLWVMTYEPIPEEAGSYVWNVFNREGVWLFRQTLPLRPDAFTDRGVWVRDELGDGIPVIVCYRFVKER